MKNVVNTRTFDWRKIEEKNESRQCKSNNGYSCTL